MDKNARYYQSHRETLLAKAKRRFDEAHALLNRIKAVPCAGCGKEYPPYVMDFNHLDPEQKVRNLSRMASNGYSLVAIKAEAAKCEVLCANCHRVKTFANSPFV